MNPLDPAYAIIGALTAPVWARKARGGWSERMGRVAPGTVAPKARPRVLLHAVSVGEASALRTLVPLLAESTDVIVSATTDTGIARARALYSDIATVVRYPLDFSGSVRKFLDTVQPDAVALTELELWPNFLGACTKRNIPVGVINGRLSARSFANYRRFRPLVGPMFRKLAFAAVQDGAYAQRFREMGVPDDRCTITGSMKWDNARVTDEVDGADELAAALGLDRSRPIVVAGSTGPGEEALLYERFTAERPDVQLVCAPRKPERFDEAAAALPGCVRRSETKGAPAGASLFLLDSIGELSTLYAVADVVVIGRSFFDLYGSDPTEPIGLGKATVIGPAVGDFESIVGAFEAGGGIVRATRDDVGEVIGGLLADPDRRAEIAGLGREVIRGHQGASERHAEILMRLVAPGAHSGAV
ncbi:MAG: glycosyltransferase N-terminal domain-containing protein [Planctomycetota bacterium]